MLTISDAALPAVQGEPTDQLIARLRSLASELDADDSPEQIHPGVAICSQAADMLEAFRLQRDLDGPAWDRHVERMRLAEDEVQRLKAAPPAVQAEPVAWMVGNDPMTAATYNAGDKEKAFDAAKRWNWPITGLSVIAGAPDFDINYQQTKPVGEWRMKNGEPMHVIWRAKYKPQLGDKLYAAPPAVQSMEQRLRDALEAMGSKKAQTLTAGDLLQVVSDVDAPARVKC